LSVLKMEAAMKVWMKEAGAMLTSRKAHEMKL
jgi:hypothetical protein